MNADYTEFDSLQAVGELDGFEAWAKGKASMHALRQQAKGAPKAFKVFLVPWSIPDPVVRLRAPLKRAGGATQFLMISGQG